MTRMDPLTVEDMFFAADLASHGCDLMADQICSAKTHDESACLVMACRELIEETTANPKLLELIVATDETNFRELQRREQLNRQQARRGGR
jgi:hypothetical protein